jgi:hypothetical protein
VREAKVWYSCGNRNKECFEPKNSPLTSPNVIPALLEKKNDKQESRE